MVVTRKDLVVSYSRLEELLKFGLILSGDKGQPDVRNASASFGRPSRSLRLGRGRGLEGLCHLR